MKKYTLPAHVAFSQAIKANTANPIEFNLSNSCAQSMSVAQLCQLADAEINRDLAVEFNDSINEIELSYSALQGSAELRKAILNFHQYLNQHQTNITEHNVLTFCGAQEAMAATYQCLLQPEDEIIVVTPCYPSLVTMAQQIGCGIRVIELKEQEKWQLTLDHFIALISDKTKLIVLNSPHNPSGSIIDSALADQVLQLAKKFDCYILSDDVSQASNYRSLPLAHKFLTYDKAIVVAVLSKSFGLAGIRLGWAVSKNAELVQELLAVKSYGSICCSVIDEKFAEIALLHHQKIIAENNSIILNNIRLFQRFIDRNSDLFSWHAPQAGILALVKCHFSQPIEEWATQLAHQQGILVLPSALFGMSGQYFRLGLGQRNLFQTLVKLQQFIDKS